jgi:hypothetical protein
MERRPWTWISKEVGFLESLVEVGGGGRQDVGRRNSGRSIVVIWSGTTNGDRSPIQTKVTTM